MVERENAARGLTAVKSICATAGGDRGCCSQDYFEIEPRRPVLGVVQIESPHLVEREVTAAVDLPQPGQSRRHEQALSMPILVNRDLVWELGPWSDNTHFTLEDIYELRKFIQAPSPHRFPDFGKPRVVGQLEKARVLILTKFRVQLSTLLFRAVDHAAELDQDERNSILADAFRPIENRSR